MNTLKLPNFMAVYHAQNEINAKLNAFRRLGIEINSSSEIVYTWQKVEYINKEVTKLDFFNQLSFSEKLALCLACTEEDRNNHVDDSEIWEVNKFFEVKVTRDLVTKMHSRFI